MTKRDAIQRLAEIQIEVQELCDQHDLTFKVNISPKSGLDEEWESSCEESWEDSGCTY